MCFQQRDKKSHCQMPLSCPPLSSCRLLCCVPLLLPQTPRSCPPCRLLCVPLSLPQTLLSGPSSPPCRLLCCVPLSLLQTLLLGPPSPPCRLICRVPTCRLLCGVSPLFPADSSGSSSSLGKSKGIDVGLQHAFYSPTSLVRGDSGGLIHIR